ncbi:hypothetical protein ACFPFV_12355 [Salinicoccus siamensis]|uniref:hypothetical protein n=1 Tax=Salinicoccus siamensis TaxID=381830 RepID=UPI00360A6157
MKEAGIVLLGTATTVREAEAIERRGLMRLSCREQKRVDIVALSFRKLKRA